MMTEREYLRRMSLTELWRRAEPGFAAIDPAVAPVAGKIGFHAGAATLLSLLDEIFDLDRQTGGNVLALKVLSQWRDELDLVLRRPGGPWHGLTRPASH